MCKNHKGADVVPQETRLETAYAEIDELQDIQLHQLQQEPPTHSARQDEALTTLSSPQHTQQGHQASAASANSNQDATGSETQYAELAAVSVNKSAEVRRGAATAGVVPVYADIDHTFRVSASSQPVYAKVHRKNTRKDNES
jgi:hypothetical protein